MSRITLLRLLVTTSKLGSKSQFDYFIFIWCDDHTWQDSRDHVVPRVMEISGSLGENNLGAQAPQAHFFPT